MCAKISYGYRRAHEIIANAKKSNRTNRKKKIPLRAYYCPTCKQWHSTSKKCKYDNLHQGKMNKGAK